MTPTITPVTLACDLDGTLTFDRRRPAPVVLRAFAALVHAPRFRVVVATARTPRCVRRWFTPWLDRVDMVCCNGALTVTTDGEVRRRALPAPSVRRALQLLDQAGAAWCAEYGDHFVASHHSGLPWMGEEHRRLRPRGRPVAVEGVLKLCVAEPGRLTQALAALEGVVAVPHASGEVDLVAAGVSKAAAVAELTGATDGPGTSLVAFGNDRNDLELLHAADRGYVVGPLLTELDGHPHLHRLRADPRSVAWALAGQLRGQPTLTMSSCTPLAPSGNGSARTAV